MVRPPESHPIVQIHVDDNSKIPDLAFYPVDSPIDKIAMGSQANGGRPGSGYGAPNAGRPSYNAPNGNSNNGRRGQKEQLMP